MRDFGWAEMKAREIRAGRRAFFGLLLAAGLGAAVWMGLAASAGL